MEFIESSWPKLSQLFFILKEGMSSKLATHVFALEHTDYGIRNVFFMETNGVGIGAAAEKFSLFPHHLNDSSPAPVTVICL